MPSSKGRAAAGMPSPSDIAVACEALQEIKRQLKSLASVGGKPTPGLLVPTVDNCPEAVVVTNDRAEIRTVNGAAARLTGLTTRELQSLTWWDITHTSSQMDFDVLWKEFLRARLQRGHYTIRNRAGEAVEVAYCSEAHVLPGHHVSVLRRRTDL